MNIESFIWISPQSPPLILIDPRTDNMGLWTDKRSINKSFKDFVTCGPKNYALQSQLGRQDMAKSKGFYIHWASKLIDHFESLKN